MVRVKICGIRTIEDAQVAVDAGAHALGFVFAASPRRVDPERAREIIVRLPPFVARVGVFVNQPRYEVQELASFCKLDVLQFHGEETPEYCKGYSQQVVKAFRVRDQVPLAEMRQYAGVADAYLLDAYHPDLRGGTGQAFKWELVRQAVFQKPVILAGGLTPENITQAIQVVRPYAVDVSSGVEADNRKDPAKTREFLDAVRRVTGDVTGC
ncbi:N-(5'-phosphoribosyl)anthranilate isomerase [Clostridiales bacterium PH28_bin88]|nr:N-(5'-phosphoribosyl)anthranilate isomerase [Clostridiales bacterium PH28_bin88]